MIKRVANKPIFIALISLLFFVLCLAPAVPVAGDSNKRVRASITLENLRFPSRANRLSGQQTQTGGVEQFHDLLPAGLNGGFATGGGAILAQSKDDGGLAPQASYTFTNSNPITINDFAVATPYPSNIRVSNIPSDPIFKVTVGIENIDHTFPDDIDILLVGPQGQKVILMSDAGGEFDIPNPGVDLGFNDAAGSFLPDNAQITQGVYKPTNYEAGDSFPAPAPAGPYASALSAFNGTNPLGFWNLYVVDDAGGDIGSIQLGWSLTIETLAVTNTNDSGPGSLRQAILNANSNPDLSTIPFRIPGSGPFEILLSSALPTITSPVILDATTQSGYAGTPLVQLNGFNTASGNGLTISSGSCTVKGLAIVAFQGTGILLDPGGGNTIQGCYIGLNIGGQITQPNNGDGLYMGPTSSNNLIGGTTATARNIISGNGQYGIVLGSSGQVVQSNYIGTDASGTVDKGNQLTGIVVSGAGMTIGGTTPEARNVISGNNGNGIQIVGSASSITITGNYIGTDAGGTVDLGNSLDGILIDGTSFNTIGGAAAGARNVISGNNQNGIQILGAASANLIYGNFIGTNKDGNVDLGNALDGVLISGASNNSIGGTAAGAGNVISGNDRNGVQITGAGSGNLIHGNLIGTEPNGLLAVGNSSDGVEINSTSNATVGGTAAGAGNVISGNGGNGIYITNASGNTIQGNYIGVSSGGGSSVGNTMTGIFMEVSDNNLIGGTTAGARNVISGNGQYGMVLGSSGQVVLGNYIGTDFTGTLDLGNARDGIAMFGFGAQIGGSTAAERNVISGNNENGIQIAGSASNQVIEGNYIGTDASGISPIGNTLNGVLINGTSNNSIGGTAPGDGNRIAFNLEDGVSVAGGTGNPIVGNSIFGNGGLGIDLAPNGVTVNDVGDSDTGANNLQNFPVLLSVVPSGGGTMITGVLLSTPNTSFRIEFFANTTYDSSIYGEGQTFIGATTVTTNGNGDADINYLSATSVPTGQYISATATRNSAPFDTSEFSQCLRVTSVAGDVTNSNDSGPGSLRQAILDANAAAAATSPTTETISFNLLDPTITLSSPLPPITVPVIIDGTTQPGYAGTPIVEINGANVGAIASGFVISGGGTTIKSLVVSRFNNGYGINIQSNGNTVQGCYLGTNRQGTLALGNSGGVLVAGTSNLIGGTTSAARNLLSGNIHGVVISGNNTTNNLVQGNYIGTDVTGMLDVGNTQSGVHINGGAHDNLIGGTTAGARNIISGNDAYGIQLLGANNNLVQGNYIGTDVNGASSLGNSITGVSMSIAQNNTIGGTTAEARNLISGNGKGFFIDGNNNQVQGNFIGTNVNGTAALGNSGDGVLLIGSAENNLIGGTTAGARNLISGNGGNGILITGSAPTNNQVQGNYIGTDVSGAVDLGNVANGVLIDSGAYDNLIGGTSTGARNIISGNNNDGVHIESVNSNQVQGNYIGTNAGGTAALGNSGSGVSINNSFFNTVGGASAGAGNVISGNALYGVEISGGNLPGPSPNNQVQGNYIGTDASGTAGLGNSSIGIFIRSGASTNTIGGTTSAARNIISGNGAYGIFIKDLNTENNQVQGNYIGTDVTGTAALGNLLDGVRIGVNAANNTIGGTTASHGNIIAFNKVGVLIFPDSRNNAILSNSIHSNTRLGIDLATDILIDLVTPNDSCDGDFGANFLQNFPVITSAITSGGTTSIQGTLNSYANASFTIQFFANATADPTGYGEGQTFIGSTMVTTNGSCNASFTFNAASAVPAGQFITATATDANNDTSEFSQAFQVTPPTAIEFAGAMATGFDDGVLIEWQTGMEVDNLGFNLYREEAGKQTRLNSQLLAGSALTVGPGVMIRSGFSYSWWDDKPANQEARYWIEDVDLSGLSVWHGPFYAKPVSGKPPAHAQATSLSQIARAHDVLATHPLEALAPLVSVSQATASAAFQQAELAASRAIKIGVKQSGWYHLTQAELVNIGLDPKTDPRRLRLFADGVEVPISVVGEDDGRFDAGDAVEFYGLGLNTPVTDTRLYWLTSGAAAGLRINKTPFAKGDPASEGFACTVERRDRSVYFAALRNGDEENFFGAVISGSAVEQKLTLNHLAPSASESAILEVSLQGVTNLAHQISVSLNGSPVGHLSFNGQAKGEQKIEVSQALLRAGENTVTLQSSGGPGDVSLVDFIRVTYQHRYRAENDSLSFTAKGGQTTTISGFSSKEIRVFDVTEERQVEELSPLIEQAKDGYAATVTAPSGGAGATGLGERKLLALADDKALRAVSLNLNLPSNLRDGNGDYIVITKSELAESVAPLIALRRAQGYSVALVDLEDIFDEFSFGEKTPAAVKDFLAFASSNWKKKPRFVLLAGDASYDPRNYLGFGDLDLLPTRLIDTDFMETASDDWFSDFSGDGIGELATGRLPARTAEELSTMVAKIVAYEQAATGDEAVLVADTNEGYDFEQATSDLRSLIPSSLRVTQVNRGRLGAEIARRSLFDALYRKPLLVNYVGHGSINQWRAGLLTNEDGLALGNDRLPFFVMMSCLNGYFQHPELNSLGESLLKAERGGAVAVWASSGMTLPEAQATLNREFYQSLFNRRPAIPLGEAIREAKAAVGNADIRRTWILLGDPAIKLK